MGQWLSRTESWQIDDEDYMMMMMMMMIIIVNNDNNIYFNNPLKFQMNTKKS